MWYDSSSLQVADTAQARGFREVVLHPPLAVSWISQTMGDVHSKNVKSEASWADFYESGQGRSIKGRY
jgi:hypothetical protein